MLALLCLLVLAAVCAVILRMNRGAHTPVDNNPEPDVSGSSSVLVAYFTWSGHGQQMARWVAEETGGELFRIVPEVSYGDDYSAVAERAKAELDSQTRPALSTHIDPAIMAQYDTIYLGFPIWWYDLPAPVWTFLEEDDLAGKTIIPFYSYAGRAHSGVYALRQRRYLPENAGISGAGAQHCPLDLRVRKGAWQYE